MGSEKGSGSFPSVHTMPSQPLLFLGTTRNQGSSLKYLLLPPDLSYYYFPSGLSKILPPPILKIDFPGKYGESL